jgi:hypothetical protein
MCVSYINESSVTNLRGLFQELILTTFMLRVWANGLPMEAVSLIILLLSAAVMSVHRHSFLVST